MKTLENLPDYLGVTEIATKSFENMRVEAFMEGQPSVMFDEPEGFNVGDPPRLFGRSRGWTPVHAQLAGLAGCTAITVAVAAGDLDFNYRGLETKVRSLIDVRGFMADFDRRPEFCRIDFDLFLDTVESANRIRALGEETEKRCPQLGVYQRAQIPMVISWYRAGEDVPAWIRRNFLPGER